MLEHDLLLLFINDNRILHLHNIFPYRTYSLMLLFNINCLYWLIIIVISSKKLNNKYVWYAVTHIYSISVYLYTSIILIKRKKSSIMPTLLLHIILFINFSYSILYVCWKFSLEGNSGIIVYRIVNEWIIMILYNNNYCLFIFWWYYISRSLIAFL